MFDKSGAKPVVCENESKVEITHRENESRKHWKQVKTSTQHDK
jgi:hypothetical protein